ncbi:MAG: type I methionyl aminopeptidase [Acidimicrobiales bacterium]|nr:type I methionyl aminopeptidase [Acidimicrobiales bacterium]
MLKANDPCWCGSGRKFKRCHRDSREVLQPGVISPMRSVPSDIPRPDYAETGTPVRWDEPRVKSADVIERMRRAGAAAAEILELGGAAVAPGVTTDEIDALVHQAYIDRGGYPSTLNYRGYPKSLCTSVNEVICHGIPDDRPLREGDIVNLDVTIFLDGVHGDTNATFAVGTIDDASKRLVDVTRECLDLGMAAVRPGRPFSDIGQAIETHAHRHGFEVVRAFVGHGIGEQFHTDLQIPHYFEPRMTTEMEPGMVFTIEPMISIGTGNHRIWADDWTAVTADGSRTAQFEHTVLVTGTGVEVLTLAGDREEVG